MHLVSHANIPAAKFIWRPGHGGFAFTVVCKATFELRPDLSVLANQQEPVNEADEWTETGSLLRSTDLVPFKKRPEVLVVGDAHAPEGRPVTSVVARLVVGEIDKSILVVGDRYMSSDGRFGESAPFARMPLVWERAAGGQATENPVGRAVGAAARNATSEWTLAPNLYPPGFEGTRSGVPITPVGFSPISPLWPSRLACLKQHANGWDPVRWYDRPLPNDIDFAYLNAAPADQQRAAPFADEMLYLENLHPRFARLSTRLPNVTPVMTVDQGAGPEPLKLRCDTLVIDTNRGLAMLVWRGHIVTDRPDRSGHIVVTVPGLSATTDSLQVSGDIEETAIVLPSRQPSSAVVLPFANATTAPVIAAPPSANVARELLDRPALEDDGETIVPGHFIHTNPAAVLPFAKATTPPVFPATPSTNVARELLDRPASEDDGETIVPIPGVVSHVPAVLPFAGASSEQVPVPMQAPPYQPPIEARGPVIGSGAWMQLSPDKPNTPMSAMTSAPVQETKRPADPEPDAMEARLRTIQRAIWKGDRPIQQILAEHGLTELEWRAAKRASARKSNV